MVTNNSCDYQPTQFNVLTGGASGTINNVAPSATSGVPVISQGSSSQPIFGTAVVAGGGTGNTSATAFALQAGGTTSTGAHQSLTTGTSGQFLQSGGSAALPTWVNASVTGNLVLIQSQTASSSASLTFTTGITATYNTYLFVLSNILPATNGVSLELQISTNGGSTYIATGYTSGATINGFNSTGWANANSTTFDYISTTQSSSAPTICVAKWLYNVQGGGNYQSHGIGTYNASGTFAQQDVFGYNATTTINAFKFLMSSGNIASGVFTLYGLLE